MAMIAFSNELQRGVMMATGWVTKFSIFVCGYDSSKQFDPSQCLYRNFANMCGLSLFRNNSDESKELIDYLKKFNNVLKCKKGNTEEKVNILDGIIIKINDWKAARANKEFGILSSRTTQVDNFLRAIQAAREKLEDTYSLDSSSESDNEWSFGY